jgi:hypothetical protein
MGLDGLSESHACETIRHWPSSRTRSSISTPRFSSASFSVIPHVKQRRMLTLEPAAIKCKTLLANS